MRYAESGQDPYCYPESHVLRNIAGLTEETLLQNYETESSQWQQIALERNPVKGDFDLSHLKEIHRRLFHRVYDWAGDLRTVNISKDDSLFALHPHIESYGTQVFHRLQTERAKWEPGIPPPRFFERLADYLGEINALHPFREGNGRAQRIFVAQLARQHGIHLLWERITASEMIRASIQSMAGNNTQFAILLEKCSETIGTDFSF